MAPGWESYRNSNTSLANALAQQNREMREYDKDRKFDMLSWQVRDMKNEIDELKARLDYRPPEPKEKSVLDGFFGTGFFEIFKRPSFK